MKKIIIALVVMCILTLGVGCASADDTLPSFLNQAFYNNKATIVEVDANSSFSHHNGDDEATVKAISEYFTGNDIQILGYYNATKPSQKAELTHTLTSDNQNSGYLIKPQITGITNFGLYYKLGSTFIYSQTKLNSEHKQYARVFSVTEDKPSQETGDSIGDRYIFCFDDGSSPLDYKDLIVEIHPVDIHSSAIPEFQSIAVPVAAIIGLMFVFGRRKQE